MCRLYLGTFYSTSQLYEAFQDIPELDRVAGVQYLPVSNEAFFASITSDRESSQLSSNPAALVVYSNRQVTWGGL
jgi:hypothetical protein